MCLGVEARKAGVNDLLAMAARKTLADPREMAQRAVVAALFDPNPDLRQPGILHHSLTDIDRRFLIPAMESLLQNDDALARYGLAPYLSQLTDRDLAVLLPEIVKAVETMAPSDEMFGDGIRLAGLDLLSRLHIREGMPLCVSVMEVDRWNGGELRRNAWSISIATASMPKRSCLDCEKYAASLSIPNRLIVGTKW